METDTPTPFEAPAPWSTRPLPPLDPQPTEITTDARVAAARRADLARRLVDMRGGAAAQVLDVDARAAPDVIRDAYERLALDLHPDRFHGSSPEVRAAARAAMSLARSAYDALSGAAAEMIPLTDDQATDVERLVEAERHLRRGRSHLEKQHFTAAREAFRRAVDLAHEEGEYHAFLAWATYRAAAGRSDAIADAERHLDRAGELSPRLDRVHVYRAFLYKERGDAAAAEQEFERALQCNPDCAEALEELRLSGRVRN
jgi:tetratricopeptide (TPR) repeat protein